MTLMHDFSSNVWIRQSRISVKGMCNIAGLDPQPRFGTIAEERPVAAEQEPHSLERQCTFCCGTGVLCRPVPEIINM